MTKAQDRDKNQQETLSVPVTNTASMDKVLENLKGILPKGMALNLSEAGTLEVIFKYADQQIAESAAGSVVSQVRARMARGTPGETVVKATQPARENVAQRTKPMVAQTDRLLGSNEIFAGIQEGAMGEFIAYEPGGEVSQARINEALKMGGFAPFEQKSPKAQLGEAVRSLPSFYRVKAANKGRAIGQRWQIERNVESATVGEAGTVVQLVVSLDENDNLVYEGNSVLEQEIRREFDRLFGVVKSVIIGQRVEYFMRQIGGVKTLFGWFIPKDRLALGRALKTCVGSVWGHWGAIPVASVESFRTAIKDGLLREIKTLGASLAEEVKAGMTSRVAVNRLKEIRDLEDRVLSFRPIIGDGHTLGLRTELAQLRHPVEEHVSDTEQRGALIREEMGKW